MRCEDNGVRQGPSWKGRSLRMQQPTTTDGLSTHDRGLQLPQAGQRRASGPWSLELRSGRQGFDDVHGGEVGGAG